MRFPLCCLALVGAAAMLLGGCSTAPETNSERAQLHNDTDATMSDFKVQDPSLDGLLRNSYGYAIFPSVGKGAVGVGAAYGQGQVYENGKMIGYADMSQANVGASIGGQTFAELIVFRTPEAMQAFKSSQLTFTADVSAVAAKAGAASNVKWTNDIAVFSWVKGGLMADAAIGGQKFNFQPLSQ
jgi:lipid-binding SYLF domain-containing protein